MQHRVGQIETHLLAKLADELSSPPPPPPTNTSDRWLLASQLQKAIRRGHRAFAGEAAARLVELDPQYLWRRLRVIAVEDIGLANMPLVATTLAIGGKRALQKRLGEYRVLHHIVAELCGSIKNRTACELSCWIDFSSRLAVIRRTLSQIPT